MLLKQFSSLGLLYEYVFVNLQRIFTSHSVVLCVLVLRISKPIPIVISRNITKNIPEPIARYNQKLVLEAQ